MANISETKLYEGGLNIIIIKYETAKLQHLILRSHRLEYIKRYWTFEHQLEFAQGEKIELINQLRLAKPDVIKIHILLEFYSCYISRLQFCIEFEKTGLKWDRTRFDNIIIF